MTVRLDISIGPVQGFVSQSRRTRDLWGSSYLLSFLSAHAMLGAERAGGRIVRPLVGKDELYQWVKGHRGGSAPRIGSVPNHFVAEVDGDAGVVAHEAREAFDTAWKKVEQSVWCKFVEKPAEVAGSNTRCIWDRQVATFWEMNWTAGPSGDESARRGLLARRKHWRSHQPGTEPGDKCTIMHDLQELSGHIRSESKLGKENQDCFWRNLRALVGLLDLRKNERLCAVALVKRLFPKVADSALGWNVDRSHWPSTVYVAAVPWIRRVATAAPEKARSYAEAVKASAQQGVFAERRPPVKGLSGVEADDFVRLDANWFHREFVESRERCPLPEDIRDDRTKWRRMLKEIAEMTDETGRRLGTPDKYYALLLADGDRLGKLVSELQGQLGRKLADFIHNVEPIVKRHSGVTIYAGGDDVLAMLPLPDALPCAAELAKCYREAFAGNPRATLSAAVVFAHVRRPLSSVISEAHRLLDDVAKDSNGRDSLAAGVLKPGGLHCQWTTTWTRKRQAGRVPAHGHLDELVKHIRGVAVEPGVSSALVYRARATLTMLCGWDAWEPGKWGRVPDELDVRAFFRAEIARTLPTRMEDRANEVSSLLCDLLRRSRAGASLGETKDDDAQRVGVDALLLARFLAGGEEEETL